MKKVLISLFAVASLVTVMSCGGSGSGTPADANSTVGGAAVSAALSSYNPGGAIPSSVSVNETIPPVTVDETLDCSVIPGGVDGTLAVAGTINITASDTAFTIAGDLTETMTDCTITDTACDFGNVVGNGALAIKVDGGSDGSNVTFTETVKGDLTFVFKSKTLACAVDLTLNVTADTEYTQTGIENAFTGTICGADWASVRTALRDTAELEKLCAAYDAAATNL